MLPVFGVLVPLIFFFLGLAQLAAVEKQLISFRLMMWVNYGSSSCISQLSVHTVLSSRFSVHFWAIQILSTGINGISFLHLVLISVGTLTSNKYFFGIISVSVFFLFWNGFCPFAFDCFAF